MKIKPDRYLKELTCLYVEDEEGIREPFSIMIQRYFKQLYIATNGEEAVNQYKAYQPDIILSDIRMPIMDGITMAANIKEENPDAIIVFITAFSDVDNLKEAIDLGVDGYITKPVDKYKLIRKLNKLAGYIKHKNEMNEFVVLLKEILDKQKQPIVVLEHEEIKLKNKAFEELFNNIETFSQLYACLPIELEDGIQKLSLYDATKEERVFEVNIQKINSSFILISFNDITQYAEEIYTDSLTQVYNRKILTSLLPKLLGEQVFIIMLDIDNFKQVNDTYGHLVGDDVLQNVALILQKSLRKEDKIIRWGGEEFVIILKSIHDETIAVKKAELLRQKIASFSFDVVKQITCSFGVCNAIVHDSLTFDRLLEKVDKALYKAKANGKNRVEECDDL